MGRRRRRRRRGIMCVSVCVLAAAAAAAAAEIPWQPQALFSTLQTLSCSPPPPPGARSACSPPPPCYPPLLFFSPAVFLSNLLLFFRLLLQRLGPRPRRQASGVGGHCPPFPEEACCWPARLPPGEKNHLDFKSSRCSESSSGVKEFPQFPMLRLPHPSKIFKFAFV